jgi:ATP-binding cassette subfamily B protein IrtA
MVNWQRGVMRAMGIRNHAVEVVAVHDFADWYRRVTFAAPELVEGLKVFPTAWLRLWAPSPRGPVQRGYTLVNVDKSAGTFDLDFVLHAAGPAAEWARQAAAGIRAEVALTPRPVTVPDAVTHLWLAGDATALPAINSWIDALDPGVTAAVFMVDPHGSDGIPCSQRDGVTWTWLTPADDAARVLAAALAQVEPVANAYAWAAGERRLVQAIRPVVTDHLGCDRAHQFTQAYWIAKKPTA